MVRTFTTSALLFLIAISAYAFTPAACQQQSEFTIGAGIYDITGPAAEQGMMGYGMLNQKTSGILQRLYARAFVIESPCDHKRVVLVTADLGQVFQVVREHVIKKLNRLRPYRYSGDTILISATHQHSGPGGHSSYALYNLSTLGFDRMQVDTIVDGMVEAILIAERNMQPAHIEWNQIDIPHQQTNRSPNAYQLNPKNERLRYAHDTDSTMRLLKFQTVHAKPIGLLNWFPVHGTSMNNKNTLINGDNKGYAAYLMERDFHSRYDGNAFVAAFAQSNAGDVSPNPLGEEGKAGVEGRERIEKSGKAQYHSAKRLWQLKGETLKGGVDARQVFIDMSHLSIPAQYTHDGKNHTTCTAAIGISMLAGTQDGEGFGRQGARCHKNSSAMEKLWCSISSNACQGVKPIALETGSQRPEPWTPRVLPIQIIQIGPLHILALPFEITTMAGRRLQERYAEEFKIAPKYVVITSLANAYAGYITTPEEYQLQRYEGASNHFGEWTLPALQFQFNRLGHALKNHTALDKNVIPSDLYPYQVSLQTGVWFDSAPLRKNFGDIATEAHYSYHAGETVRVQFWGGHPKNNYRINQSFLEVQHWEHNQWVTVRLDRDWDTEYHWQREGLTHSLITIIWHTNKTTPSGRYRIVHSGDAKTVTRGVHSYQGVSREFLLKK